MSAKSKKRSRSNDQGDGNSNSGNARRGPVRNKKRQRRDGENTNGGGGGGRAGEKLRKSENSRVESAVTESESRRRKRKRVEENDDDGEQGEELEDSDNIAVAGQADDASRSAIRVEAASANPHSGVGDAAETTNTLSKLTPTQIQQFNIPDKVITKVLLHDWDLLCIKVRQSSRIRCKIRAILGHLSSTEPDSHSHQKKDTWAKEQRRETQSAAPDGTRTNTKNSNPTKQNGIKNDGTKKPIPIALLQANADTASKLISIVEIVKRESMQNQQSCTYFQYSGIEGRVEELRPRKKQKKKKESDRSRTNTATAGINADGKAKTSDDGTQQQEVGIDDEGGENPMKNLSSDKARGAYAALSKSHIYDSEFESESDAFQTLAESRRKLRNMPYLTIYLSRTRIPLLKSAYE